jgi:hypothetical protein
MLVYVPKDNFLHKNERFIYHMTKGKMTSTLRNIALVLLVLAIAAGAYFWKPIQAIYFSGVPNDITNRYVCIPTGSNFEEVVQILKNGSCAALLFWAHPIQNSVLKRLHLAAQSSQTLFFMFRPHSVQTEASPAVLRVMLSAEQRGALTLSILKRRGPACGHPITLASSSSELFSTVTHDLMDRPAPAQPQPRHVATPLAD